MANFYNLETGEPINTLYIGSSRKGNVGLRYVPSLARMRAPEVTVANGSGSATRLAMAGDGVARFSFTDLAVGSSIVAIDSNGNILQQIPVRSFADAKSYAPISRRLNSRGMRIDLDSFIDYVCYASDVLGEGIYFRPKNAAEFKAAITDTQLFHHDDRSDPWGRMAASATVGEGYREVSTPSLHVAIHETVSSVHIDSYAFMLRSPDGDFVIDPDVGQHVFDELLFRLPMTWLRQKNRPFIASVLQALHPVLPNSTNRYSSILGMRLAFGGSSARDLRVGMPRLLFESTYDWGPHTQRRWNHDLTLALYRGGNADRGPDWVFGLKGEVSCGDVECKDHQETVGLFFKSGL